MPVIYESVVDSPMTRGKYIRFIKDCIIRIPHKKDYIGARVRVFKDNIENEKRNFKLTIYDECKQKLVRLRVKGGFGGITRTKYKISEKKIKRYDWRKRVWEVIKRIVFEVVSPFRFFPLNYIPMPQIEWYDRYQDF